MNMSKPEPPPRPNASRPIWDLVIEDMRQRDNEGRRKYGTPLQVGNGRDPLVDAYQEALDLAVYLRQEIEERRTSQQNEATKRLRDDYCRSVCAEGPHTPECCDMSEFVGPSGGAK